MRVERVGSVRAVTDADGTVIARHDFRPFGEELSPQNPPKDRKLFTGQERDFETGLDYFYARQLRTDLGRFTIPDPMTDQAWTDPVVGASNAYAYVGGNPLRFTDSTGACWICNLVHIAHQAWDALTGYSETVTVTGTMPPDAVAPVSGGEGTPPIAIGSSEVDPSEPGHTEGKAKSKQSKLCGLLPAGRTVGVNGSLGMIGGQNGSLQLVVDYDTGEISGFATGGLQLGWNGGAAGSVSVGWVYTSPGGQFSPRDFSGSFKNVYGSAGEGPGGSVSWSSGGVRAVSVSVGVSLTGATGGVSYTATSKPLPLGDVWTQMMSPIGLADFGLYLLRQLCK